MPQAPFTQISVSLHPVRASHMHIKQASVIGFLFSSPLTLIMPRTRQENSHNKLILLNIFRTYSGNVVELPSRTVSKLLNSLERRMFVNIFFFTLCWGESTDTYYITIILHKLSELRLSNLITLANQFIFLFDPLLETEGGN